MTAERAATILASAKAMGAAPAPSLTAARNDSLRANQLAVRFGKAARHPLCQAALALWSLDSDRSKVRGEVAKYKMLLNRTEQQKKQAIALYRQFGKQEKQKETIQAAKLLNKIKEHLPTIQKAHSASVEFLAVIEEARIQLDAQFRHELFAAEFTKNTSALRALTRVEKRWKALCNGAQLKYGERREEGILQLLRDKKIKAAWAKGEAVAGYMEALSGGNRPLSDDEWQGRFTIMEFRSGLEAMYGSKVAGDKEGKQVRRALRALGKPKVNAGANGRNRIR